jgi:hypothetical protein
MGNTLALRDGAAARCVARFMAFLSKMMDRWRCLLSSLTEKLKVSIATVWRDVLYVLSLLLPSKTGNGSISRGKL